MSKAQKETEEVKHGLECIGGCAHGENCNGPIDRLIADLESTEVDQAYLRRFEPEFAGTIARALNEYDSFIERGYEPVDVVASVLHGYVHDAGGDIDKGWGKFLDDARSALDHVRWELKPKSAVGEVANV